MGKAIFGEYYTALDYLNINSPQVNKFIQSVIGREFNTEIPYHLNTYFILDRIHSSKIRQQVIRMLLDYKTDLLKPFPKEQFLDIPQVIKTIENLEKEYEYYIFYINKGQSFNTVNNLKALSINCDPHVYQFAMRIGYDIILQKNRKNQCILILNLALKGKEFSLQNLYNKLNKQEPGIWVIHNDGMIVKTIKDKFTTLQFETLKNYIESYYLT